MKSFLAVPLSLLSLFLLAAGCSYNKATLTVKSTAPDGTIEERMLRLPTFAIWPATASVEKQRASVGKTLSLGQQGVDVEGGGTNVTESLRYLDSILGKVLGR